jgi:hypothetical protein
MTLSEHIRGINGREWRFVLWITILVILLTTIPFIYGYLTAPANKFFTGLQSLAPGDFNVYYSYLEQVKQGNWIFKDIFTSEQHSAFFFNPFWLIVGLFGKVFDLPNLFTYQFFRIILTPVFLLTLYFFTSLFFKEVFKRKICFIFLIFASGLGMWFSPLIKYQFGNSLTEHYWPMDLWVSESQNFLTICHSPHFILASTLILIIFLLLYFSFEYKKISYLFYAGSANLFLLFFHPFHLPTILSVPLIYIFAISFKEWKIKWDYIFKYIVFIFISMPAILYQGLLFLFNSIAQGKAQQNICLTPVWWIILISYGFLIPLAIYGICKSKGKFDNKKIFLLVWLITQSLLIFSPLIFQRRITQGLQFPLIIFSCLGFFYLYELVRKKRIVDEYKEIFALIIIIFFSLSNLYVLAKDLSLFTYSQYKVRPYYLEKEFKEAFQWLKNNLPDNEIILSSPIIDNFIPGFSGKIVYLGHEIETLNFEEKRKKVTEFFQDNQNDFQKKQFLKKNRIKYIFYDNQGEKIEGFRPQEKDYLKLVFHRAAVSIYQVKL